SPPPLSGRDRAPNRTGGATTRGSRFAVSSAMPTGITQSVFSGRWGPCCSVEPIGSTTGRPAPAASRTSTHVMSSIKPPASGFIAERDHRRRDRPQVPAGPRPDGVWRASQTNLRQVIFHRNLGAIAAPWRRSGTVSTAMTETQVVKLDAHSVEPIPEADRDSTGLQQMWIWAGANI